MLKQFVSSLFAVLVSAGIALAAPPAKAPVPPAAPPTVAVPVLLADKAVLTISTGVLSFTADERAKAIAARLARLAKNPLLSVELITVADNESSSDIVVQDLVLMSVTEADAVANGKPRPELARENAERIRAAVTAYRSERSARSLLLDSAQALAVTLLLLLLLFLLKRYVPRLEARITSWKGTRISTIQRAHARRLAGSRRA